jgi:uncharacterized membrane protein YedE/YeeE
MVIFILLSSSASVGLAIGLFVLRVLAIILASLGVTLLSMIVLLDHGFGLIRSGLISVGSLTALQSSYLLGIWIRMSYGPSVAETIRSAAGWMHGARQQASDAVDEDDEFHDRLDPFCALSTRAKEAKRKAGRRC